MNFQFTSPLYFFDFHWICSYSPAGFIWDNAIVHRETLRDYGEFAITAARWKAPARTGTPRFLDYYRDLTCQAGEIEIRSRPGIESLRPYPATNTVAGRGESQGRWQAPLSKRTLAEEVWPFPSVPPPFGSGYARLGFRVSALVKPGVPDGNH
jgi:hypothetical protein